jgi:hypothetical protein
MKLEHKKQKLAPVPKFAVRVVKYNILAFLLVVFSILVGVIGYSYLGNLSLIDSFHMSSMILTGMGPVVEMKSSAAKLFSSFYALYSGITFLSITAVFLTPLIHRVLHILNLEED